MSLEPFVQAAGAVMGMVRDAFGLDGGADAGVVSTSGPLSTLAAAFAGSGQAASAFNDESDVVGGQVSALGQQDLATSSDLASALAAAGAGRGQMDSVIAGALDDINGLAAAPQALVSALANRLQETWQVLTTGNLDSSSRAVSSAQTAAAYSGLGSGGTTPTVVGYLVPVSSTGAMPYTTATPSTGAMAAMSPMQTMPMVAAGAMAANQAAASSAAQAANAQQSTSSSGIQLTAAITHNGSPAAAISVNSVQYDRSTSVASGQAATTNYINQALNLMGITDQTARSNWMKGLLVGIPRESSFLPWAVNDWDSNAVGPIVADGYPSGCSRGLMQTVPGTFAANHQPGTSTNIYDPVANIAAGMNYLISRYHVVKDGPSGGSNLSSVQEFNPYDSPAGY